MWWLFWSCDAGKDDPPTDDTPTDTENHSGGTEPRCGGAIEVTAAAGTVSNQVTLSVTTTEPTAVAARCVADDDPDEVVLVEDAEVSTSHELRLGGMLAGVPYTCRAAATCADGALASADVPFLPTEAADPLPTLRAEVDPALGSTGYWTLAPWLVDGCNRLSSQVWLGLWDDEGRPRWWWPLPPEVYTDVEVLWIPETGLIGWGGGSHELGNYRELDPLLGEVYASALPMFGNNLFSHDAKRLDANRVLTLQVVPNEGGSARWKGFGVRVHDPSRGDAVTLQLDSQRYVDEGSLRLGGLFARDTDPYHANWVDLLPDGQGRETVYVSLCFLQRILAIDAATGDIRWQLGQGLGWTVLDEAGAPLPEDALPQCQHGLEVRGDTLLVYDNGMLREESRASEWEIDADTLTARRTWNWTEAGWYEPFVGDIDDLGNGRVLVTQATNGCATDYVRITEVDRATGRVAARLTFPEPSDGGYRAERYDGCALLPNARSCPAVANRLAELAPAFGD
jgi:hypothetical protein